MHTMAIVFVMKILVLFSITMVTLDSVNSQIGTAQVAALLKNQADMLQIVSNLLLENNTVQQRT